MQYSAASQSQIKTKSHECTNTVIFFFTFLRSSTLNFLFMNNTVEVSELIINKE